MLLWDIDWSLSLFQGLGKSLQSSRVVASTTQSFHSLAATQVRLSSMTPSRLCFVVWGNITWWSICMWNFVSSMTKLSVVWITQTLVPRGTDARSFHHRSCPGFYYWTFVVVILLLVLKALWFNNSSLICRVFRVLEVSILFFVLFNENLLHFLYFLPYKI